MEWLSLLGILGFFSVEDMRKRSVQLVALLAAAITGVVMHLYFGRISIWSLLGGLAVGAIMYGISILSQERIGKGDALLIAVTGIFLGFWGNLLVLWIATLLAMCAGIAAIVFFQKGKNYELPFIPFVFASYLIYLSINHGSLA